MIFVPGILAVYFGKAAIKNMKDAAISCVVAGVVFPFSIVCLLFLFLVIFQSTLITGEDLGLVFTISLPVTLGISLIGGLLYARLSLGIPFTGQQSVPSEAQPLPYQTYCPRCRNRMNRTWISCPYCGYDLRDDTKVYDDKTRIY
jgi:hypothetical protein